MVLVSLRFTSLNNFISLKSQAGSETTHLSFSMLHQTPVKTELPFASFLFLRSAVLGYFAIVNSVGHVLSSI